MAVTQYIGARYVPLFAEPLLWNVNTAYEPLTIVSYQGNSYTSKQYVPEGIDINNESYWALTGNYNAQIEAYRTEVRQVQEDVGQVTDDVNQFRQDIAGYDQDIADLQNATSQDAQNIQTNASNIAAEATARALADTEIREEISNMNDYTQWRGKKCIIIGDSFSDETSLNKWPYYLSQKLGFTYRNWAVGSTGFIDPGSSGQNKPFDVQVTSGAAEMSVEERNEINYVFVYGGYNDIAYGSSTNVTAGARRCCNAITANFPNAEIILIPMNWRVDKYTQTAHIYASAITYGFVDQRSNAPVRILQDTYTWLLCANSYYSNDQLHPNDQGYQALAAYFLSGLMGTLPKRNAIQTPTFEQAYSYAAKYFRPYVDGNNVIWPGTYVEWDGSITTNTLIGTASPFTVPVNAIYAPVFKGNTIVGGWSVTDSGAIRIIPNSGQTIQSGCYLSSAIYPVYGVSTS